MANNWKYATLGQRERLSEIRKGNADMYNTEKARNKLLKEQQLKEGISTKAVDDWDATIDNAYNNYQKTAKKNAPPIFGNGKYDRLNSEMNAAVKKLRKERDETLASAGNDAQSALNYLAEWLANNGYSDDGKLAVESKKEINDALESVLKSIRDEYDEQIKNTTDRFFALASEIFRRS